MKMNFNFFPNEELSIFPDEIKEYESFVIQIKWYANQLLRECGEKNKSIRNVVELIKIINDLYYNHETKICINKDLKFLPNVSFEEVLDILQYAKNFVFKYDSYFYESHFGFFFSKAVVCEYKCSYFGRSFFYVDLLPYIKTLDVISFLAAYDYDPNFKIKIGDVCNVIVRNSSESDFGILLKKNDKRSGSLYESNINFLYDKNTKLKIVKEVKNGNR